MASPCLPFVFVTCFCHLAPCRQSTRCERQNVSVQDGANLASLVISCLNFRVVREVPDEENAKSKPIILLCSQTDKLN